MSRGRKPKTPQSDLSWEQHFNKNVGFYLQTIIIELAPIQNKNTEAASDLLNKIHLAKKELKQDKQFAQIKETDFPFQIPSNWEWCRLGEICTKIGSGSTPKGSNYSQSGIPFFRSQNIYNDRLVYDNITLINEAVHKQMKGTIVYANDILLNITGGSIGRCALVPADFIEGNVSQHVCIIRPVSIINEFLHYTMLSPYFQALIFGSTTGSGREGLPKYNLEQFPIPLPPLSEQNSIVTFLNDFKENNLKEDGFYFDKAIEDKIVALHISQMQGAEISTELTHQQDLVKQLRQAFLREAMQGKLVPQNPTDEPASELLKRIKAEKERLIASKKIKLGKLQEAEIQDGILFDIPEKWIWCKLDELCYNITDGTHQTPKYTKYGKPFLSAQHVKPFKFLPDESKFVSEEAYLQCIKNKKPELGDILITRVGAIGEAAVINQNIEFAFYVSLGLIQPFKSYVNSRYLELVINSPYGNLYSKGNVSSKGSSAGNFNLGRIRSFLIPLPPLAEQERIVQKLEQLMQTCDALQQSIAQSQQQTDMLLQQVLREALQPKAKEAKVIQLPVFQPLEENYFPKRKMLATHIINQSLDDDKFGDVKFEKILFLADYFAVKRNLGQKYYKKTAGPYDNGFTIQYFKQIEASNWFTRSKRGQQYVFGQGKNHNKSLNLYGFFSDEELNRVNDLIKYFKKYDYEQPEIVSTLYAVWNNQIILHQAITDDTIISGFYEWDAQKSKYKKDRLINALEWMRQKQIVPDGWGKLIEKPKPK